MAAPHLPDRCGLEQEIFVGGQIHYRYRPRDYKFGAGALRRRGCRTESSNRGPQHSAACESKRIGGTHFTAIVSLHPGRIRFSQRQSSLAMGTRTEAGDRRTGAQTWRGESQPPGGLRQILAFLRCCEPHCADLALASARGGAQAIAGRSVIEVLAVLAHCVG